MESRNPELQSIIDAIDIVAHIESFEPLRPEGDRYVGDHLHSESAGKRCLMVFPQTRSWYCYRCNQGGTIFDYEMVRLQCDFGTALDELTRRYQLQHRSVSPEQAERLKARRRVEEVLMRAFQLYHEGMTKADRKYFNQRGIWAETIDEQLLGASPTSATRWLTERLGKEFPDKELLLQTGLFHENEGRLVDHYVGRYIFPYWYQGKIVFSIARAKSEKQNAKYKKHLTYSTERPFVSQNAIHHILWGEDKVKKQSKLLVVEGIVDAILADQSGEIHDTVISPVTMRISNLQIDQLAQLTYFSDVKSICFVGDSERSGAGERGAWDTMQKLQAKFRELRPDEESPIPQLYLATVPRPPEANKVDVADLLSSGRDSELSYWIDAGRSFSEYLMYLENNPQRFFYKNDFIPKTMSDELRSESRFYLHTSEVLHIYEGGVFREDKTTPQTIQHKLGRRSRSRHIAETLAHLSVEVHQDEVEEPKHLVNLQNGMFNLNTDEMVSHDPALNSRIRLPIRYDQKAKPNRIFQFFSEIVPEDCFDVLLEIFAYCLFDSDVYEKSFVFLGTGSNGKGTLIKLLTAFLGQENITNIALQQFDANRFWTAHLEGKLANLFADLSAEALKDSVMFKMITSGDRIPAEQKLKKGFFFTPRAKLIFSANEMPRSSDRTFAYYKRWLIIPFPNRFDREKRNVNLLEELTTPEELSGLFNMVVLAYHRLLEQKGFSESKTTADELGKYQAANDSTVEFLNDAVEVDPNGTVARQSLYLDYKQFCEDGGYKAVSQTKFNKSVESNYPARRIREEIDGSKVQAWRGIRLAEASKL